ncbi:MAG: hypothetical protein GYA46_04130 [candidate division Zixibacteria bacterium]|nr:hypothetical protein [candidate division Zixibacteria bacterium]
MEAIGVWTAALATIGIVSFLYKDNVLYRICESVFIGTSAGYWFVTYFWDNLYRKFYLGIQDATDPNRFFLWFGVVLGVLMLTRLWGKIGWLSRWPLAFVVGATAGLYMMTFFVSNAMRQVGATIMPIFRGNLPAIIDNTVLAVGVFCGLVYFFFSKEHRGLFGRASRVGIWILMITFGASFGYTVMSRMSLMLGRFDFLFGTWLGILP